MREQTMRLVVAFHTTAEAMATEQLCHAQGLPGRLISAPRALGADCGIAWCAPPETEEALTRALSAAGVDTAGFHTLPL